MPARAVFFTWRTYGSWLPGDERGWVDEQHNAYGSATKWPDPRIHEASKAQMRSLAVELSPQQRIAVDAAIRETCSALGWPLIALNVRTNHVHVVLGADDRPAERV